MKWMFMKLPKGSRKVVLNRVLQDVANVGTTIRKLPKGSRKKQATVKPHHHITIETPKRE